MPPLDCESEHRAACFQDELDPLVQERSLFRVGMTIGSDLDRAQLAHEFLRMRSPEVRGHPWDTRLLDKVQQVLRRRSIAIDRLD